MRPLASLSGKCLFAALFALGCNADLESVCHAGPCQGTGGGGATSTDGGGGSGGAGGTMCPADPQTGDIPCEVNAVLEAKCLSCHNADHLGGAPIDLLACERFHELDCGQTKLRLQVARDFVAAGTMPLGMQDLTADEKQILLDWLDACAPCQPAGMGCGAPPGAKVCGP
jgi:hypothetical protein